MKIRTDFVTNSSSSSYCVSFIVNTIDDKEFKLDFWPEEEDGSSDVVIPLKENTDTVIADIKACESVEELRDLLLNSLYLSEFFEEVEEVIRDEYEEDPDDMGILEYLEAAEKIIANDEDDEFEYYEHKLRHAQKATLEFSRTMEEIDDLNDIESVSICELFTGWGEFARDGVSDFLETALTSGVDLEDADAVREDFEGKLTEDEIDSIVDQIENDCICQFNADITTTLVIDDGKVEKKYSFKEL